MTIYLVGSFESVSNLQYWYGWYGGISKSVRTESIMKYTLTTINSSEATQRVMAAKRTRLTHKIVIQLHLVADSCSICSSNSRRPVRKLLDTSSYNQWSRDSAEKYTQCGMTLNQDVRNCRRWGTTLVILVPVLPFQVACQITTWLPSHLNAGGIHDSSSWWHQLIRNFQAVGSPLAVPWSLSRWVPRPQWNEH
jgi:hypothetical protein